jgi:hypothetical protein
MTHLTDSSDDVLDASLVRLYTDHAAAMEAGDNVERLACHLAIEAVLSEQSRRLDVWIVEHMEITT